MASGRVLSRSLVIRRGILIKISHLPISTPFSLGKVHIQDYQMILIGQQASVEASDWLTTFPP